MEVIGNQMLTDNSLETLKKLESLFDNQYLKNGILFSSEKLDSIINSSNGTNIKLISRKNIYSMIKYVTRCLTKTSPFSTFSKTFCLKETNLGFKAIDDSELIAVNVNNYIFLYLKRLLGQIEEVRLYFDISLNSSVYEAEGNYKFFINIDNNDHLNSFKKNELCAFLVDLFSNGKLATYKQLNAVIRKQTGGSLSEVTEYLNKLITSGFLILHFPTSIFNESWNIELSEFLNKTKLLPKNTFLLQIIDFLEVLQETKSAISSDMDYAKRKLSLKYAYVIFEKLRNDAKINYPNLSLHDGLSRYTSTDLFYEDYIHNLYGSSLNNIDPFIKATVDLQSKLNIFNEKQRYKKKISEIIKNEFNTTTIPLLAFFETYCKQRTQIASEIESELFNILKEENSVISKLKIVFESDEQNVDIKPILDKFDKPILNEGFGIYFQVVETEEKPTYILNNESYGWGKNISRFLNGYDNVVSEDLSVAVQNNFPGYIIADIHDASVHNTNIYPRLTDYLIDIAGSEEDKKSYTKIGLNELVISVEEDDIQLVWKDQKVLPIHYSMENLDRKSSIVKLIDIFSVSMVSGLSTIIFLEAGLKSNLLSGDKKLIVSPRLYYGADIVINRKKWFVKKSVFVEMKGYKIKGENISYILFAEILRWKVENEIPDEIFVKMSRIPLGTKNLHKPQYINFKIPLLIECMLSTLTEADDIIEIAEMLPNSGQLSPDSNGEIYVREYIVNLV